ncbi:hypothetical protein [Flavobacterium limnosediminis]|uniref:hypothetical protein n=1 Tax=Flavobacterium limnosediminis TaxID=1401027 RepID=UPI0003F664F6|nr:hypothetical protein [Flavobacterium limnosediminis]
MDFNDIQSAWNNEKTENVVVPTTTEKLQSANTPLDKIKKNLKNEFIYQIVSIIFLGFVPFIHHLPAKAFAPFYLLFTIFVAVCVYYLVKLYMFYKRLNKTALSTKDSLYETYFDIRLNMELYKTFGFALTPFLVLFMLGFLFIGFSKTVDFSTGLSNGHLTALFAIVAISILTMGLALEWWVHHFYGKYAKEIRKVIDELKEE